MQERSDLITYHSSWAGLCLLLSGKPVHKCQVSAQLCVAHQFLKAPMGGGHTFFFRLSLCTSHLQPLPPPPPPPGPGIAGLKYRDFIF